MIACRNFPNGANRSGFLERAGKKAAGKQQKFSDQSVKAAEPIRPAITVGRFYAFSVGFGLLLAFVCLIAGMRCGSCRGSHRRGVGIPRGLIGFLIKRRQNKFLEELPNALEVMVRSIAPACH